MNKQKLKKRKQQAKQKKINRKENEDSEGVRRRRGTKPEMNLNVYYIIKAGLIGGMIFSFFIYSTLLLPLFMAYTSLLYFSGWAERKINRQYNKENQKKIFKLDAGIALITLVVSISSTLYSFSTSVGSKMRSFSIYFYRIMSLGTGVRKKGNMSMGTGTRPEGFEKPTGGGSMGGSMGGRPSKPDFDLNDLPISFVFNQILSSIIQILVISVIILGATSILIYFYKNHIKKNRLKIKENTKTEWTFNQDELTALLEEEI